MRTFLNKLFWGTGAIFWIVGLLPLVFITLIYIVDEANDTWTEVARRTSPDGVVDALLVYKMRGLPLADGYFKLFIVEAGQSVPQWKYRLSLISAVLEMDGDYKPDISWSGDRTLRIDNCRGDIQHYRNGDMLEIDGEYEYIGIKLRQFNGPGVEIYN